MSLRLVKTKRWEGEVRITTFRVLKKGGLWGKCIKEERSQKCYHEKKKCFATVLNQSK